MGDNSFSLAVLLHAKEFPYQLMKGIFSFGLADADREVAAVPR